MTSHQQIPLGIPIPFTDYAPHPYSQDFPDESESVLSQAQVQAPSVDPNQQYYPQNLYDDQQKASLGQPGSSSQLIVISDFLPEDPKRAKLKTKIKDVEERLSSGWYNAYNIWLEFSIGLACYGSLIYSLVLAFVSSYLWNNGERPIFFMMLILVTWSFWLLQQSLVMKHAMRDKNLKAARRGLISIKISSIYYLLTLMVVAGLLWNMEFRFRRAGLLELIGLCAIMYTLPMFVQLYGAKKVIGLLEMRENWVLKLNKRENTLLTELGKNV